MGFRPVLGVILALWFITEGHFNCAEGSIETVQVLLANNKFESCVGHESTAQVFSTILGREVECKRQQVQLNPEYDCLIVGLALLKRIEYLEGQARRNYKDWQISSERTEQAEQAVARVREFLEYRKANSAVARDGLRALDGDGRG